MPRQMSQKRKDSFLKMVAQKYEQGVADRCKEIMEENPNLSAMAIVQRALGETMPTIDMTGGRFDSWPRLRKK